MIYLDNAATTRKKPFITKLNTLKALTIYNANPSRGSHTASIKTALKVEQCRENIKKFVNAPANSFVVYTYNCTEAINFAILGSLSPNSHVIITTFEHNAVLRTLNSLKDNNVTYSVATPSKSEITLKDITKHIKPNTKMIIVNHTSNVTGTTTNLKPIGDYCKKQNLIFMVDGAQSLGHNKVNVKNCNINYLAIAGHKGLYGTQGIGALVINNVTPNPIKFGGSGTNSESLEMPNYYPDKMEAGTLNTLGILALDGGISYIAKKQSKINKKTLYLSNILLNYLSNNKNYILYSKTNNCGVISFNHKKYTTTQMVNYLNENKICVRGGLHCSPLSHNFLGTLDGGTIRVSLSYFNTKREIKKLIRVLEKLEQNPKLI